MKSTDSGPLDQKVQERVQCWRFDYSNPRFEMIYTTETDPYLTRTLGKAGFVNSFSTSERSAGLETKLQTCAKETTSSVETDSSSNYGISDNGNSK